MKFEFSTLCIVFLIGLNVNRFEAATIEKRFWVQSRQGMCYYGGKIYRMSPALEVICQQHTVCICRYVVSSWW